MVPAAVASRLAAVDRRISLLQVTFRSVGGSRRAGIRAALLGSDRRWACPYASPAALAGQYRRRFLRSRRLAAAPGGAGRPRGRCCPGNGGTGPGRHGRRAPAALARPAPVGRGPCPRARREPGGAGFGLCAGGRVSPPALARGPGIGGAASQARVPRCGPRTPSGSGRQAGPMPARRRDSAPICWHSRREPAAALKG